MSNDFESYPGPGQHAGAPRDPEPASSATAPAGRRRPRALLGFGAVLVALIVVAAAVGFLQTSRGSEGTVVAAEPDLPERLVVNAGTTTVTLAEGDVDRPTFHYRVSWDGAEVLTVNRVGDTLTADLKEPVFHFGFNFFSGSTLEVTVPRGAKLSTLEVNVDTGDIKSQLPLAAARLKSDTGSITASGVSDSFWAESDTGSVELLDGTATKVEISTSTGSIKTRLTAVPTSLVLTANTGSIEAVLPEAVYQVAATTDTGSVTNKLSQDPDSSNQVTVTTDTGDIRLRES